MAPKFWRCEGCKARNERVKQKCATPGCNRSRPPKRVPVHARTLRDDSYETYVEAARQIHGVADESCCVCGKPRSQERRHDRDHGHNQAESSYGRPRGLACVSCNRIMVRELTHERALLIAAYLERVEAYWNRVEEAA